MRSTNYVVINDLEKNLQCKFKDKRSALIFELNTKNCFFLKPSFHICRKYINSPSKKTGWKKNASDVLWF